MDETHTIAAALPTAENDEQTQFHGRAPRPTAVTALEDLMPRELFIRHIMDQVPSDYPSLAVVNRSFNDTMCQPRVILFRGMTAWTSERVRELTAADPPHEHFIQTLWVMQATGQLTEEIRSRNPTLVQAWALAEANPPPPQLQAMLAALAAQHLHAAEAA